MNIQILSGCLYLLGMIAAIVCIYVNFKSFQLHKKNLKLIAERISTCDEILIEQMKLIQESIEAINTKLEKLDHIEMCVKDLNVRITIAEVRLEERKPQMILPALPSPAKRGRKPKHLT